MEMITAPTLAKILRTTLERLESDREITRDDPRLRRLKRSILQALADLEIRKATA